MGLTLDQFATAARRYGMTWDPSAIRKLETGKTPTSMNNLIVITKVIEDLTGQSTSLPDLFPGKSELEINAAVTIRSEELRKALSGQQFEVMVDESGLGSHVEHTLTRTLFDAVRNAFISLSSDLENAAVEKHGSVMSEHIPTLAEKRAAKKTGLTARGVAAFCLLRYGMFLDDEAARRAGDGASAQKKGRMTRDIIAEIDLDLEMRSQREEAIFEHALSDDERRDMVLKKVAQGSMDLAALRDDNKELEMNGDAGPDWDDPA